MKPILPTLLLFTSLLLPTSTSPSSFASKTTPLVEKVERSLVRVEYGDLGDKHNVCTGFVTSSSKGEALTAKHCLPEDGETLFVDGQESEVVRENDLFALVGVEKMKKPPLDVSREEAEIGSEAWTFGFGWGAMKVFHRYVAAFMEKDVVLDGPLAPGMSGGPVVNGKGEVIGINQAANSVVGVACGIKEMREFLKP